ncbi:hypothetical protein LCGC14_2082350 [marine sediment metagenome]|uniref:Uncharacterized protein n=1 Tax=marine sediment metagenome TaxID=412755 RepID=A0A0F9GTH8_9ZZZZ
MPDEVQVDLSGIQNEIDNLSEDELKSQLLSLRTRQKVQQKKYQSPERQKAYQLRKREREKLMKEKAIEFGFWDQVNEEANAAAEAIANKAAEASAEAEG